MKQQELNELLAEDHSDETNSSMQQLYARWLKRDKGIATTNFTRSDLIRFALFCLTSTATDSAGN